MIKRLALVTVLLSVIGPAIAGQASDFQQRFNQAQQLANSGQVEKAIKSYLDLVNTHPQVPELYNNLAALYLEQKDMARAREILERGLHAHKGYGALYDRLRDINVAIASEAYSEALQLDLKTEGIKIPALALSQPGNSNQVVLNERDESKSREDNKQKGSVSTSTASVKPASPLTEAKPTGTIKRVEKAQANAVSNRGRNEAVKTVINAWAAAWSAQAVDVYLSFYHDQYSPVNGMTTQQWRNSRKVRVKKPRWIKVALSDFAVERNNGRQAIVRFKQVYESDRYSDVSKKRLVLLYTDSGWRIFREKSI